MLGLGQVDEQTSPNYVAPTAPVVSGEDPSKYVGGLGFQAPMTPTAPAPEMAPAPTSSAGNFAQANAAQAQEDQIRQANDQQVGQTVGSIFKDEPYQQYGDLAKLYTNRQYTQGVVDDMEKSGKFDPSTISTVKRLLGDGADASNNQRVFETFVAPMLKQNRISTKQEQIFNDPEISQAFQEAQANLAAANSQADQKAASGNYMDMTTANMAREQARESAKRQLAAQILAKFPDMTPDDRTELQSRLNLLFDGKGGVSMPSSMANRDLREDSGWLTYAKSYNITQTPSIIQKVSSAADPSLQDVQMMNKQAKDSGVNIPKDQVETFIQSGKAPEVFNAQGYSDGDHTKVAAVSGPGVQVMSKVTQAINDYVKQFQSAPSKFNLERIMTALGLQNDVQVMGQVLAAAESKGGSISDIMSQALRTAQLKRSYVDITALNTTLKTLGLEEAARALSAYHSAPEAYKKGGSNWLGNLHQTMDQWAPQWLFTTDNPADTYKQLVASEPPKDGLEPPNFFGAKALATIVQQNQGDLLGAAANTGNLLGKENLGKEYGTQTGSILAKHDQIKKLWDIAEAEANAGKTGEGLAALQPYLDSGRILEKKDPATGQIHYETAPTITQSDISDLNVAAIRATGGKTQEEAGRITTPISQGGAALGAAAKGLSDAFSAPKATPKTAPTPLGSSQANPVPAAQARQNAVPGAVVYVKGSNGEVAKGRWINRNGQLTLVPAQ